MNNNLPVKALSVRQPWAWAIIHAGKDVENRSWRNNHFVGPVCIHASKGMTMDEYDEAAEVMSAIGVDCPPPDKLQRGGIIGIAEIAYTVRESDSPWFFGPLGLVMENQKAIDFIPVKGALGFFLWERLEDKAGCTNPPSE